MLDDGHALVISNEISETGSFVEGRVSVYDSSSNRIDVMFSPKKRISCASLSIDKSRIAIGYYDGTADVRRRQTSEEEFSTTVFVDNAINSVSFIGDDQLKIRLCETDKSGKDVVHSRIWNFTKNLIASEETRIGQRPLATSPKGRLEVRGSGVGNLKVIDSSDQSIVSEIRTGWTQVNCVAISDDEAYIVVGTGNTERPRTWIECGRSEVAVWEIRSAKKVFTYKDHVDGVICVALTADGAYVASGDLGGRVIILPVSKAPD